MKTATVQEAKQNLELLIAAVQAGETVTITDGGTTVASLTAGSTAVPEESSREALIQRLDAAGLVRRNPRMPDPVLLEKWGISGEAEGLLQALLDEREENW